MSLGAYEAGVNWALLEILRQAKAQPDPEFGSPVLVGVTGGSAGAINALLTALTWCRDEDADASSPERNWFARTWLPIGFDTLVPPLDRYAPSDPAVHDKLEGLLSRTAFAPTIDALRALVSRRFRPGCRLALGLTVTRIVPGRIDVAGLTVPNQRFVIPLKVSVDDDGRIHFRNQLLGQEFVGSARTDLLGNVIYLARRGATSGNPLDDEVDVETVLDAVQASSAFPVAFGPVRLRYWVERSQCPGATPVWRDLALCNHWFMDGGVFDNIPLGVAMAQLESDARLKSAVRPLRYLYIDSSSRRRRPATGKGKVGERTFKADVVSWGEALAGAVATARGYELHNVLRYNLWNQGTPWLGLQAEQLVRSAYRRENGGPSEDALLRAAAARGKPALEACLQAGLDVFGDEEVAGGIEPRLRQLEECFEPGDTEGNAFARDYLAAVAVHVGDAARALESARRDARSAAETHARLRLAVLRLVGILDELSRRASASRIDAERAYILASHASRLARDRDGERLLQPSRRFFPLTASHMSAFGAFLDEPLRRYDYDVGIHDALYSTAEAICISPSATPAGEDGLVSHRSRIEKKMRALSSRLLSGGPGAALLAQLRAIERAHWEGTPMPKIDASHQLRVVLRALVEGGSCTASGCEPQLDDRPFSELIASLRDRGYRPISREMKLAMRDPERWWVEMGIRLLVRQREIETDRHHSVFAGSLFFLERSLAPVEAAQHHGAYTLTATVPDHAPPAWQLLRVLPHEVSTSLSARRAVEGAWQPFGIAFSTGVGQLRVATETRGGMRDHAWFVEAGGSVSLHRLAIPSSMLFSSFGAAAGYSPLGEHAGDTRGELFFTTLSDRLRFAFGTNDVRDLAGSTWRSGLYVTVGLADLPGSIYAGAHRLAWLFD